MRGDKEGKEKKKNVGGRRKGERKRNAQMLTL